MDCMQFLQDRCIAPKGIPFQYRKRYGLHAILDAWITELGLNGFNTASGMDCMQFKDVGEIDGIPEVSIPQAVWIACNTVSRKPWKQ